MQISSVMKKSVKMLKPSDTALKAVRSMNTNRIGCVLIVDKGKLLGVITERDVLRSIVSENQKPKSILCKTMMSSPVKTIEDTDDVIDAIDLMATYKIKKIPVLHNKKVVGIITVTDILRSGERIEYAALKKLGRFFPVSPPVSQGG
ncbi:MAG: CBS domain-containing protein [Candidatus Aenigmarchaeota archaeon]|nr:CBS domain-containing protein [Candidatus Aenigmarchaeota archaeon]